MERPRNLLKRPASSSVTLGSSTVDGKRESEQKKKYFIWKTYSDGSQVKEYLDKEQIAEYKLSRTVASKKIKLPEDEEESSVRNMLFRKTISPSPRPRELPRPREPARELSRSREPDVRNRIGAKPTPNVSFSRSSLNVDRNSEQQKSVKSRLSLPSSGSLRITKSAMSIQAAAVPKARNKITAPTESDTRIHRIAVNERLGSRGPKARKRITGPEASDDQERNDLAMDRPLNRDPRLNRSLNDRIGGNKIHYKRN